MIHAETIDLHPVVTDADIAAYVDVRNRIDPSDPITTAGFGTTRLRRDRLDLLAVHRSVPVGMGFVGRNLEDPESAYAFGKVGVLLEQRRQGIGTKLFRALSDHARSFGADGLIVETREDERAVLDYLSKRGYETVFRAQELALDVAATNVRIEPPPGVDVETLTDVALDRRVYDAAVEIERDLPAIETVVTLPFAEWCERVFSSDLLRACSFAAVADGIVVGVGFLYERPWGAVHGLTGVRREWRRRGVARAIKCAQISAANALSMRELRTSNEVNNAAISQLNANLGFRPLAAWLHLRGPLIA